MAMTVLSVLVNRKFSLNHSNQNAVHHCNLETKNEISTRASPTRKRLYLKACSKLTEPQPATRNPQPATRNPQPATRNPQPNNLHA
jgi:hypothetical protein